MSYFRFPKVADARDEVVVKPLQVEVVNGNFEDAFRRFKTLVQAEGVIALYKSKQTYEKPSIKKRRKQREAEERRFLTATREAQMASGEWDRRMKKKEQRRLEKIEERRKQHQESAE